MSLRAFRENPGIQRFPRNEQDWVHFVNEAAKFIADAIEIANLQTSVTTAEANIVTLQTDVQAAARSSYSVVVDPGGIVWNANASGTAPADDTQDITLTFYDETDTQVAQRVLRGTFTNATETIAVTNVSSTAETGYSTSFTVANDGSEAVRADVVLTFPDGSKVTASAAWTYFDPSTAGITPDTGGGK